VIGRLRGIIAAKQPPELLLDVSGVCYELFASMNTFYALPDVGSEVSLHTHMVVREDAQLLYGFYELRERQLFRMLIRVNGVGPKMALAILSSIDPESFALCVANNDVARLTKMPGVGKKTAERLIVEMRDRLPDLRNSIAINLPENTAAIGAISDGVNEAISALIALGYKAQESSRIVMRVAKADLSAEEIIRLALQSMA
jgi:Holliday junction DNA helicase RuvA